MFLSKRIANYLFGKHSFSGDTLNIREGFDYPDGKYGFERISWPGNEGLIVSLHKRIKALEDAADKKKN